MALYEELEIDQGSTFRYQVDITTSSGDPYDLNGFTITSQIRKTYKSTAVAGTFTATNPEVGRIILTLTDEETAAIAAGRYVYDVFIQGPDGQRYRVLEGMITVTPSVTQI